MHSSSEIQHPRASTILVMLNWGDSPFNRAVRSRFHWPIGSSRTSHFLLRITVLNLIHIRRATVSGFCSNLWLSMWIFPSFICDAIMTHIFDGSFYCDVIMKKNIQTVWTFHRKFYYDLPESHDLWLIRVRLPVGLPVQV